MSYAELNVTSNFTFLTGASHPSELIARSVELGLPALSITDTNTFAGIVRAYEAAREQGVQYIVGVCLLLMDGHSYLAYPTNKEAYGRLCRLLTTGKRRAEKGECQLHFEGLLEWCEGSIVVALETDKAQLRALSKILGSNLFLGLIPEYDGRDYLRFRRRAAVAKKLSIPLVATGNVIMHRAKRRPLADILTCIREKTTIDKLGRQALLNDERRLKSPFEMHRLFRDYPEAVSNTLEIVTRCRFSLSELTYEYPEEITGGQPPLERLKELTEAGLAERYPEGVPLNVQAMVTREFRLIEKLDYAKYFLTVYDIVHFARSKDILCQGRGSAANSVICYALGITSASPEIITMVFERFVSEARNEPPDIDVDFEHQRREEVIQHIYQKYGRDRAALTATVVHYRTKRAIREVCKAMGLSEDAQSALTAQVWGWSESAISEERIRAAGLDPTDERIGMTLYLIKELIGFPRHLSQHVGGFVMSHSRVDEMVPIENARMEDRTVIEWDKDDLAVLGMMKMDVLGLGMLSCLKGCFDLIADWKGTEYALVSIPQEDPQVYEQLSRGDTLGLFQVESRAQMSFLPRMRPDCFYDLVIEVAIIRPGPIQGDMVHPYLRRRRGEEEVNYPSLELEEVLKRTLGVPLFQEQAMQIAMVAARFDPSEADALRRTLAAFRKQGNVSDFHDRFVEGCVDNGYDQDFAERCFRQLEGFSGYGFPESHAASFALLVYASAWLRHHHPEVYLCAMLNAQPLGFYAPSELVQDGIDHGVEVRPACINQSYFDAALEPDSKGGLAVRLGFRQIKGFKEEDADWLVATRGNGYEDIASISRRAGLQRKALEKLATADAFAALGFNRRDALWHAKAIRDSASLPLLEGSEDESKVGPTGLPALTHGEDVFDDFISTRLSLKDNPVRLVRHKVSGALTPTNALRDIPQDFTVSILGAVITRQRPGTASGVIFITLKDETGVANVIVWPKTFERFRAQVMQGRLLNVRGKVQKEGLVIHVIAQNIEDHSYLFDELGHGTSESIEPTWSGADEAKGGAPDHRKVSKRAPTPYQSPARHPREQAKKLFQSRDFH